MHLVDVLLWRMRKYKYDVGTKVKFIASLKSNNHTVANLDF